MWTYCLRLQALNGIFTGGLSESRLMRMFIVYVSAFCDSAVD